MRAFGILGVLGLLVAMVLFFSYAYLPYTQQVVSSGQTASSQAEQMAGLDSTVGGRVTDHLKLDPVVSGNRLMAMQVRSITPGSSYQKYFGVMANDRIEQIGPQTVRDIGDEGMAQALAVEAYQRKWDLVIVRNGQRFTLPQDAAAAAAVANAQVITPAAPQQPAPQQPAGQVAQPAPGAQPGQPAQPAPKNPNSDGSTPLQRQLDAITNYGL